MLQNGSRVPLSIFIATLVSQLYGKKDLNSNFHLKDEFEFFGIHHRVQNRASLYDSIVFPMVGRPLETMVFGSKNEFIVFQMRSNVANRESTWVLETDKV